MEYKQAGEIKQFLQEIMTGKIGHMWMRTRAKEILATAFPDPSFEEMGELRLKLEEMFGPIPITDDQVIMCIELSTHTDCSALDYASNIVLRKMSIMKQASDYQIPNSVSGQPSPDLGPIDTRPHFLSELESEDYPPVIDRGRCWPMPGSSHVGNDMPPEKHDKEDDET